MSARTGLHPAPRPSTPADAAPAGAPSPGGPPAATTGGERPRPFFAVPPASGASGRRVLLVAYNYPPDAAIGGLRWQKMSRFLAERGWSLDVVMLDPDSMENVDRGRLGDVPPGTRLFGVPHTESPLARVRRALTAAYRRLRPRDPDVNGVGSVDREAVATAATGAQALRIAYIAWSHHSRYARWARDAARRALEVFEPGVHEAVITSGPPHMAHEAGVLVARRTGLPLVMDMRDPWSLSQRLDADLASPVTLHFASRFERRAVATAELIVLNTEPLHQAMREAYPEAAGRMITVMNGADEEPLPPPRHADRFTIAFAGTIYIDRSPLVLFRAARKVVEELGLTPAQLGIELIGNVEAFGGVSVRDLARQEGIDAFVELDGPRPRREALEFLSRAHMLVNLPQDSMTQIPAKTFEYVCFDAWLLVFTPAGSATDFLLRGTGADVVPLDDVERTAAVIRQRYLEFGRGIRPSAVNADGRFSRATQARILLDALEARLEARAGRSGLHPRR